MSTLTVGIGKQYARIGDAVSASGDGDTILVDAGTYRNDFATVAKKISIVGVGGLAKLEATTPIPNGKAILITQTDVVIENLEFSGATVGDGNGAGIRYEGGTLVVRGSFFHDNQNGILGGAWPNGKVIIESSEFARNGSGDGQTHGIYLGAIAELVVRDSYIHDTLEGHLIKSRALKNLIEGNVLDGGSSTTSYEIDLPNGGDTTIRNNTIVQAATTHNSTIISYSEEAPAYAGSTLLVDNNVIVNHRSGPSLGVVNRSTVTAQLVGNEFYNVSTVLSGPGTESGSTTLSAPPLVTPPSPTSPAFLTGTPGVDTLLGGSGADIIDGKAGDDLLSGGGGNDTLLGGSENDRLVYTSGFDLLDGGAGSDIADFSSLGAAVYVDLTRTFNEAQTMDRPTPSGGTWRAAADLVSIENLVGTAFGDSLIGDAGDNVLSYTGGYDGLNGGAGNDTADFSRFGSAVDVNLTRTFNEAQTMDLPTLSGGTWRAAADVASIENVTGTNYEDSLTGDANANRLTGGGGNDVLSGGGGADRFDVNSISEGLDTITDFTRGTAGDKLDIHDVLVGYTAGSSNINNFVQLSGGASTTVSVNADGAGSDFVALATLQNVANTAGLLNELIANGNLIP